MTRRVLFCLILSLVLPLRISAESITDFVALLLNNLEEEQETVQNEDFNCITVSPTMMDKVLKMIQKKSTDDNGEQIQKILPNIKSMRIFSATKHPGKYYAEATELLSKKAKNYKPFKVDEKKKEKPCVWIRKNGNKVVEMVVLDKKNEEGLHIINITGNMNKAFVDELLKM